MIVCGVGQSQWTVSGLCLGVDVGSGVKQDAGGHGVRVGTCVVQGGQAVRIVAIDVDSLPEDGYDCRRVSCSGGFK